VRKNRETLSDNIFCLLVCNKVIFKEKFNLFIETSAYPYYVTQKLYVNKLTKILFKKETGVTCALFHRIISDRPGELDCTEYKDDNPYHPPHTGLTQAPRTKPKTHIKRRATRHDFLPSLLDNGNKYGMQGKLMFVLGSLLVSQGRTKICCTGTTIQRTNQGRHTFICTVQYFMSLHLP